MGTYEQSSNRTNALTSQTKVAGVSSLARRLRVFFEGIQVYVLQPSGLEGFLCGRLR
jgi:hypothetical protein